MEEGKSSQAQAVHRPVPFTQGIILDDLEFLSQGLLLLYNQGKRKFDGVDIQTNL
jgi:hypothetical protein